MSDKREDDLAVRMERDREGGKEPEKGIRHGWERAAPSYREGFGRALAEISHSLANMLPSPPPEPVLDLACGPGTAMSAVDRHHGPVLAVGCDFSHAMAGFARKVIGTGHGVVADQDHLPFAPGTFGTVISSMGTIFSKDPEAQLSGISLILKDGGHFAFSAWGEPHETALGEVSRRVVGMWPFPMSQTMPPLETPYSRGRSSWLDQAARKADLEVRSVTSHWLVFRFADRKEAARALSGTGRLALLTEGDPEKERELLEIAMEAFRPHEDPRTGRVELSNRYHLFHLVRTSFP
ncbi:MAG: class I SAM-dependent methyltransferase [Nitrospirae bacterium]|nr:class I SAM-dependent methyltransferase [Nitrospirota bacterium]